VSPKKYDDEFLEFNNEFDNESDLHEELEFDETDDFDTDHLIEDDYDENELERRRTAYADLKRNDKIFNNTYNLGLDTSEEDEETPRHNSSEIKLDSSSPDYHMYDPDRYSDHVDLVIVQKDIYKFLKSNQRAQAILGNEPEKKKFVKAEINELFELILKSLGKGAANNVFVSPIHVLDSISSTVNMEYKKLFDMMNYDNKELLLVELNSKYGFLDSMGKNYKMF
jgi:hypothetical protein